MATYVTIEKTIRQIIIINDDVSLEQAQLQPIDLIRVKGVVVGEAVIGDKITETSPVPVNL